MLVLTSLSCLCLLDQRASHETHSNSTCSARVIARASAQPCLYLLQLRASISLIHVPHMKPTVTLRATHTCLSHETYSISTCSARVTARVTLVLHTRSSQYTRVPNNRACTDCNSMPNHVPHIKPTVTPRASTQPCMFCLQFRASVC